MDGEGEVLQPLLYALAAESLLKLPVESGRLFDCTQRGGFREQVIAIDEHARRAIQLVTDSIDESVRQGFFPLRRDTRPARFAISAWSVAHMRS